MDLLRVVVEDLGAKQRALDELSLEGPPAIEWMLIAQAFAGPPAPGPRPGQFRSARR